MRNRSILACNERMIPIEQCRFPPDRLKKLMGTSRVERLFIASRLVRWGKREMFESVWNLSAGMTRKVIAPPSAMLVPFVDSERRFYSLNNCDATTGVFVTGPKSLKHGSTDKMDLALMIQAIYTAKTSTMSRVQALSRRLRIGHTPALAILRLRPDVDALVTAALPHFAAQAAAARLWLEDQQANLCLNMSGFTILQAIQ